MKKLFLKKALIVAMSYSIATIALAEDSAPVYDADNYPPEFAGQTDSGNFEPIVPRNETSYAAPTQSLTLEQRVSRAEQQINNLQHNDSGAKVESLKSEIQTLRNQVEELNHQLQQMQTQQRTLYSDLEKRVVKQAAVKQNGSEDDVSETDSVKPKVVPDDTIQTKTAVKKETKEVTQLATAKQATTDAQPNVAEEQQIYQTAYNLIKSKKYNDAIATLQKMTQKYPSGQFAANAHYWLGELYGLIGNNDQSFVEFNNVVKNYPDSPKVADAQLKIGLINAALFKWSEAKSDFRKVMNRYPGTASARLAAEQLKQIKAAGH